MLGIFSSMTLAPVLPLADSADAVFAPVIAPLAVVVLCAAAGIGTILLLPGKKEPSVRMIGGSVLTAAGVIFALLVARTEEPADIYSAVFFWIFSAIAIVGAVRVITHSKPVYSALYFVLTVFASAGLFILLYAEFMAAALILIYAGAILITYVFVIMLAASAQTPENAPLAGQAECDVMSREPFLACCICFVLMGVMLFVIFDQGAITSAAHEAAILTPGTVATGNGPMYPGSVSNGVGPATGLAAGNSSSNGDVLVHGSTQSLGEYLFENQLVSLELAGLLLTIAMVGAIVIARRRVVDADDAFEPSVEVITASMTPVDDSPQSIPVYGTRNPRQKAFPEH